jgi:hypothetical protein
MHLLAAQPGLEVRPEVEIADEEEVVHGLAAELGPSSRRHRVV